MNKENEDINIKEIDGIPCICLDNPIRGAKTPLEFDGIDEIIIIDFTSLQESKEFDSYEDLLKELKKFFKY